MKKARILHNPGAGEGETKKRELIKSVESAGFNCSYSSTKQFRWENIETEIEKEDLDFLILAGGDGTVRKVAEELLSRKVIEKTLPLGLLPLGTANNIARTLEIGTDQERLMSAWHHRVTKKYDVGKIKGLDKPSFFLESFGFGLFPRMMKGMKKISKTEVDDPKERLHLAQQCLLKLIDKTPAKKCRVEIDDQDHSGEYLLVEVMNTRAIGPNIRLSPKADPGDGVFDVILIAESQRGELADYVSKKIAGLDVVADFPVLHGRQLTIVWEGKHVHVDDEYHKTEKPVKATVEMREGLLEFLVLPDKA